MPPFLSKIVAILLVASLLTDPGWPAAFQTLPLRTAPESTSLIDTDALNSRPLWLNASSNFKRSGQQLRAGIFRMASGSIGKHVGTALRLIGWYELTALVLNQVGLNLPLFGLESAASFAVLLPFRKPPRNRSASPDADLFSLLNPGNRQEAQRWEASAIDQLEQLRNSLPTQAGLGNEEAVDLALGQQGWEEFDFKGWREKLQQQLRKSPWAAGTQIHIYFLPPPQSSYFFGTPERPSPVLFHPLSASDTALFVSLPMIEDLDSLVDDDTKTAAALIDQAHDTLSQIPGRSTVDLRTPLAIFASQIAPARGARPEKEDETAGAPWLSAGERERIDAMTSGIHIHSQITPSRVTSTEITRKNRPSKLTDVEWFRESILELTTQAAQTQHQAPPATYEKALEEWTMDLTHYPFAKGRCAYNHAIDWGFNFYHPLLKVRIQLGPDEIVKFGFLTRAERDARQENYRRAQRQANEEVPYLQTDLLLLRYPENVEALLQSSLSAEDKLQVKAFARIASRPGYYQLVNVFGQEFEENGQTVTLSWDALMRIILMARQLEPSPEENLRFSRSVRTEGEHIRLGIALAVQMAQRGDSSGWRRIATRYAVWVIHGSPFSIWVASMMQFVASVHRGRFEPGKPLNSVQRIGTFADGPALAGRALYSVRSLFESLGMNPAKVKIFSFDFVTEMLAAGRAQMPSGSYHPVAADITQPHLPLQDGSLDMALTGLFGTIEKETPEGSDASQNDEGQHKAHFLSEMNRVLSMQGYLFLTVKNRAFRKNYKRRSSASGSRSSRNSTRVCSIPIGSWKNSPTGTASK